jgi:hypothetical protein
MLYIIKKDENRYGDLAKDLPDTIIVEGTLAEAVRVAEYLSGWYVGCEYIFYVEGPEGPDQEEE